ncbi:hypothetical protein [Bacteroides heparinolyticus]|uniref:hypothetical protein n=1 Tax=Prevotella heparinolytica TaxID=28113 RepID=UPI00359FEC80
MDDRMYFLCYIESNDLAQQLKGSSEAAYAYETGEKTDFWYRYLFGDGLFKGISNGHLQVEEIKRCSYARWIGAGTLIGITRDSSVYVSNWSLIGVHFRTMYYQMAILCLIQRASVLRFSGEISYLTSQIRMGKKRAGRHIKELYENYIRFLNEVYFREVTSQIQGMEMYEMFHKNMNIERDTKALETEMTELFGYLDIDEQSKLNRIANVYLPLGLWTSVLGINTFMEGGLFNGLFGREGSCSQWMTGDIVTILVMLFCFFVPIRYYLTTKK